jgi:mediator of RNA polymerase II transcription subunit 14
MEQIHDFRVLHQQRIQYTARKASPDGHRTTVVLSADMLPHQPGSDGTTQTTWASRFIEIKYKGPAPIPPSEYRESLADPNSVRRQPARQRVMVEATVGVLNPAKFRLLRHSLDRDVLYDRRLGEFTLRFQPESGAGIIPLLRSRMQSLGRLVDIVDALYRGGKRISPKKITLREIVFSYGNGSPAMSMSSQPSQSGDNKQRSWEVRLNLAAEQRLNVILEAGNPHLRAIDYLRSAANSTILRKLPAWFVFTRPLYEALEQLHDSWDAILAKEQGTCYVFHKSLDWITIRFALSGAKNRRVQLDIQPRDRNGHLNWHISRATTDPNVNNENDEFNKVLKQRVWSTSGNGFKGLVHSATAQWDTGIGPLLALINEALQSLAGTPPPPQAPTPTQQPQQQPSPHPQQAQAQEQRQQQQQQQQQQPNALQGSAMPGRFPHQLQQGQQLSYHQARLQQQQRQQHMHNQNQAQQGQQRAGMGDSNTPVVVLD